jgi:hypothetical protein
MGIAPDEAPRQFFGVGVDEELVRVEAEPALRLVPAVNPITIELPGCHIVQIAVPDVLGALGQGDALNFAAAVVVEEAELDLLSVR